jgi:hypothetical protein
MADYYHMELKGLDRLTTAMKKAPALVDRELQIFFHSIVRHLETEVVDRTPEVTGDLRRSINGEVRLGTLGVAPVESGALGSTPIEGGILGVVGSNLDYAPPVELGSKPHKIAAKNAPALHFMVGGKVVTVKSVNHPGSKGAFMFQRAFDANKGQIESGFEETVSRIIQKIGNEG